MTPQKRATLLEMVRRCYRLLKLLGWSQHVSEQRGSEGPSNEAARVLATRQRVS